jgi:hypothetical protein
MFRGAYTKIEETAAADLIARVNPHLHAAPFDPATATVLTHPVTFYPGYTYADITHHGTLPPLNARVIFSDSDTILLDTTNAPIFTLNKKAPIRLTDQNVADYVRFFFSHVRGAHGRFLMIDTVDDIDWKEEPPPSARKAIGKMLTGLQVTGRSPEGDFILSANMIFKNALFGAKVHVSATGDVTMSDEELLVEDMPVLEDTIGQ